MSRALISVIPNNDAGMHRSREFDHAKRGLMMICLLECSYGYASGDTTSSGDD